MHSGTKRELLTGAHYLFIGIIAEVAVINWSDKIHVEGVMRLLFWALIFAVLSILRFFILIIAHWARKDEWQTISRRFW